MKSFKTGVFIFVFLFCNLLVAQEVVVKSYQLEWENNVSFSINRSNSIYTEIIKGQLLDDNLWPVYNDSWKLDSGVSINQFSLKNVVYEDAKISPSIFRNVNLISNKIKADFKTVKDRFKNLAVLQVHPYINDGGSIKKIIAFDLEYSIESVANKTNKSLVVNSVLSEGTWYKFAIDTTGVFKIDKSFLQSLGINLDGVNPKNIQVFGNGGTMLPNKNSSFRYDDLMEVPILVQGEEDGKFDANDYVLFYGKGPHQWKIPSNPSLTNLVHENNIYADESYYFVKVGSSAGKRVTVETAVQGNPISTYTNFHDYTFFEKDETNLYEVGQQWFGDNFTIRNSKEYVIPFKGIDSSSDIYVKVRGVVESGLTSSMLVKVNDQNLYTINFPASSGLTHAAAVQNSGKITATGNAVKVNIEFNNGGNPSVRAFLDYIEVLGKKKLIADTNQFSFRNFDALSVNGIVAYTIGNKSAIDMVWDVSDPFAVKQLKNKEASGVDFFFNALGGSLKEYIVLSANDYYKPIKLKESSVQNQNLHALKDVDYVIVTQDYLVNQAERLANYHRLNSGLNVEVIRLNQIYNEFASGSPDLTGIRDFIKHLYDNSTTNKIKYVCLFGDASFDYKNRIGGNNNIVPVFEAFESFNLASSYVTDDYYGMMDADEGEMLYADKQDVATGRIPVTDVLEAENVVDKILSYYNENSFGAWRTNVTLIADDIDAVGEEVLQENMEKIGDSIAVKRPEFNLKKIYLDAYKQETTSGGTKYPTVNVDILNQVESGTVLVNYFGHGGEDGLAAERIFDISMIQSLKNQNKLPLFVTITCQFSRFDNPLRKTAGEYLFWNKSGGSAALVTTTREVYISVGQSLNEAFVKPLLSFNNEKYTISEALMQTKNLFTTSQRFFIFNIGDPAMNLAAPKPNIKLLKMNDKDVSKGLDTIKALSYTKIEGIVTDINDQPLTNFNGELNVVVFDKPIIKTTLDNDFKNKKMEFDVIESKLFSGRSKVENGVFSFDFIAPKDLKIAYGKGKISFYANNTELDKVGYNNSIFIGGIDANAPVDETGPNIKLYLNDLNFLNGANVNESPLLIAVIEDESGINTSITAVDHDIVAIIDGDVSNPIILNDYYQTELDDFKKGKVSYQLRDLTPGFHTITLKAWDTYNNLSETSFSFIVVNDEDLVLSNVLNYPNPFINYTEFWFNHNKPNELLNVQVQIFTVSGKLVKTINESIQTEGNLCKSISWDGLDDFGSKIGKGVYIYKLKVKAVNSNATVEKIEKLVILQ